MLRLNFLYCGQPLCLNYRLTGLLLVFTVILTSPHSCFSQCSSCSSQSFSLRLYCGEPATLRSPCYHLPSVVRSRVFTPLRPSTFLTPLLMYCAATFRSSCSSQSILPSTFLVLLLTLLSLLLTLLALLLTLLALLLTLLALLLTLLALLLTLLALLLTLLALLLT